MTGAHLARAWRKHWPLQIASVTVMTLVLLLLNLLFLSYSAFNQMIAQWGQGLEMIVYVKDGDATFQALQAKLENSGDFDQVKFISKSEATQKFLTALGPESLELLKDPKWKSPIPASFELRLSSHIPSQARVASLETWAKQLHGFDFVEDVFYGQGWVENFSRFVQSARGLVLLIWGLSMMVGLLIVSNCIRLSFLTRKDEIEVLELVGATAHFIRWPFLVEGLTIGVCASALSLLFSFVLHSLLLDFVAERFNFWVAFHQIPPLQFWYVGLNLLSGLAFGWFGAWNCVRKLNTGWAAAAGR